MSSKMALEKCPELIFVPHRFSRYKEISLQIREIFKEYTDLIEPLSLDEAYLDVTQNKKNMTSANEIAREIRQKIFEKTGLTASAGISVNKFLAKIASDINKPNGQKTIHPDQIDAFLSTLPIEKFYGVGKVTSKKMKELGIFFGKDLSEKSLMFLVEHFGRKSGFYYYNVARGIHNGQVIPDRIRKSVGVEHTFDEDIVEENNIAERIEMLCEELFFRLKRTNLQGRTLTLKIKYYDFSVFTRSKSQLKTYKAKEELQRMALFLWKQRPHKKAVRLLGVSISNLNEWQSGRESVQLYFPFVEFYNS